MSKLIFYALVCIMMGCGAAWALRGEKKELRPLAWLVSVLPFASGGFYSFLAPPVSAFLIWYILKTAGEKDGGAKSAKGILVYRSLSALSVGLMTAASLVSVLWAADHGMAAWAIVRYLPLLLFALALMQNKAEDIPAIYRLLPLSAAAMTALSFAASFIPALTDSVSVAGRLAGFFEYPNTFAAFLLAGLVISGTAPERKKSAYAVDALLIFGILQSGSRTAFILLALVLVLLCIQRKELPYCAGLAGLAAAAVLLSILAEGLGLETQANRFLTTSTEASTFLGRLLYFRDALGQILTHPLGLGYQGYYYTQGSFQTGVYSVMFVHNELLQLLLDLGWLPTGLFCLVLARTFFAKHTPARTRLLLLVLLGHSMMDFDLQFLSVWFLLLPLLPLHEGKLRRLKLGKAASMLLSAVLLGLSFWLGAGDALFTAGKFDACLSVTPFCTAARMERLKGISDPTELEAEADKILQLNDKCALAYSAKANAAYSAGDVLSMIENKEAAIACNRYAAAEYRDYFEKLYTVMELYEAAGDTYSLNFCRNRLLSIPDMLAAVEKETSALAWRIADKPELMLPEDYNRILQSLK